MLSKYPKSDEIYISSALNSRQRVQPLLTQVSIDDVQPLVFVLLALPQLGVVRPKDVAHPGGALVLELRELLGHDRAGDFARLPKQFAQARLLLEGLVEIAER